jgi:hypothetical protein
MWFAAAQVAWQIEQGERQDRELAKLSRDVHALRQRLLLAEKMVGLREGESKMPDPFQEGDA